MTTGKLRLAFAGTPLFAVPNLLGTRLGTMHGTPYMQFIAPGLIMMAVISNAYTNVSSSFFSAKFTRSIEEMLVTPMQPATMIAGFTVGGMIRGLLVGMLVAVVTRFFTHMPLQHPALTVMIIVLSSLLFSLAGLLNGIYANSFDDIAIIPTFVITPLTYLGGVFYSIDRLPLWWHKLTLANPILYLVSAFRYGILGISEINIFVATAVLWGCVLALLATCWWCIKTGKGLRS